MVFLSTEISYSRKILKCLKVLQVSRTILSLILTLKSKLWNLPDNSFNFWNIVDKENEVFQSLKFYDTMQKTCIKLTEYLETYKSWIKKIFLNTLFITIYLLSYARKIIV